MGDKNDVVLRTFRALVEGADRKFARVRDVPAYGHVASHQYFHKVFKAYTKLWKYQQEHRSELVDCGLKRWEIGEIASRIGQLYFGQYMRTSEARFLVEAYVFYEAILNRRYFEGSKGSVKDLGVRFKELRFYARFLLVSLILNRTEMVKALTNLFKTLVDDSKASFRVITDFTSSLFARRGILWNLEELVLFTRIRLCLVAEKIEEMNINLFEFRCCLIYTYRIFGLNVAENLSKATLISYLFRFPLLIKIFEEMYG